MNEYHVPVLFDEMMTAIGVKSGGVYVDGTLGGGGHASGVLTRLDQTGFLYAIDKDEDALLASHARFGDAAHLELIHGDFHDIRDLMGARGVAQLDGVMLDLGVSSHQLDTPERGFSYHDNAFLDMRMNTKSGETAADLLAKLSEQQLTRVFYDYGEEKWAARIAKTIVSRRAASPILMTLDLTACVDAAVPKAVRAADSGHPARRVFQALRIAVNDELAPLGSTLESIVTLLKPSGRLCVITFHSLEDRIVKQTFARLRKPCTCPPSFPMCICGKAPVISDHLVKPILPSDDEVQRNPRARSAKLRVAEKL